MSIIRYNPMRDFVSLREVMDRLLEDSVIRPTMLPVDGRQLGFAADLKETPEAFVLTATLPGVKADQLDINATSESVIVRAETKEETEQKEEHWLLRERRHGTFERTFTLPTQIDPNKVEATFEDGVLTLTLPKSEAVRPKQIKVKPKPVEAKSR
jgi:HSP20 family protein